jgi:hypothetical protein
LGPGCDTLCPAVGSSGNAYNEENVPAKEAQTGALLLCGIDARGRIAILKSMGMESPETADLADDSCRVALRGGSMIVTRL